MINKVLYPLVSVIIPVYNSEKYFEECLSSVTNQTYDNLEIIIIDDGSTDLSGSICDKYAENDERIYVIHKDNQGRSRARNDGLKLMTGEYFTFVDADDVLVSNAIELMVNKLREDTDIVFARMMHFFPDREIPFRKESFESKSIPYDDILERYLLDNMHGTAGDYEIYNGPVARIYSGRLKEIQFAEDLSYAEDYLYSVMMILNCRNFCFLDRVVYRYRRFHDEDNDFWGKFSYLSVEASVARTRSLMYVKDNEDDIYQDYLLKSYYAILDLYCECVKRKYIKSSEKIAKMLDMIKNDVRSGSAFREMNSPSKLKIMLSFVSYRLYAVVREVRNRKRLPSNG